MPRGKKRLLPKSANTSPISSSGSSDSNKGKIKRRKISAVNDKKSGHPVDFEVEEIKSCRIAPGSGIFLQFLVSWVGFLPSHNSWEPLDNLRNNTVFIRFINQKFREFETELFVNIANIKERIKGRIRRALSDNLKFINMLEVLPFDPFEYKVHQVFYHLIQEPTPAFIEHLENLVYRNHFFKLEEVQRNRNDKLIADIKKIDDIMMTIENDVDFESPPEFIYCTKNCLADEINMTITEIDDGKGDVIGCQCENGECSKDSECCPKLMKQKFPYKLNKGIPTMRLNNMDQIYECNDNCSCSKNCLNRVSQQRKTVPFCLFKTEQKGWGLKAMSNIKKGTFIIEYVGELVGHREAGKREINSYLFDLNMDREANGFYTIDAYTYGNVARFVNHSCEPNSQMWFINDCRQQAKTQKLCIFAERNISKDEEITIDYCPRDRDKIPTTSDRLNFSSSLNVECQCGSKKCRECIY